MVKLKQAERNLRNSQIFERLSQTISQSGNRGTAKQRMTSIF